MRIPVLLASLLLSGGSIVAAPDPIPPLRIGTSYAAARGVLITKGFRPVPSREKDGSRCSAGRQDVCSAYPETVSCSGTGDAGCRFIFSGPKGIAVTLDASGRDVGNLKIDAVRRSGSSDARWQRTGRP